MECFGIYYTDFFFSLVLHFFILQESVSLGSKSQWGRKDEHNFCFMSTLNITISMHHDQRNISSVCHLLARVYTTAIFSYPKGTPFKHRNLVSCLTNLMLTCTD